MDLYDTQHHIACRSTSWTHCVTVATDLGVFREGIPSACNSLSQWLSVKRLKHARHATSTVVTGNQGFCWWLELPCRSSQALADEESTRSNVSGNVNLFYGR
eukprot:1546750-Amphidinium_carterae.1